MVAMDMFSILQVRGSDAREFLQGQLTQDIGRLQRQAALPAAWCNPKGRVIVTTIALDADDGVDLVLPGSLADEIETRLSRYRLRADVRLQPAGADWGARLVEGDALGAVAAAGLLPEAGLYASRRRGRLVAVSLTDEPRRVQLFGPTTELAGIGIGATSADEKAWRRAFVAAGAPLIEAAMSERFTPHMLNLDLLGAVSFSKGCYTGQEVVARTQHLGRARRRLFGYRLESGTASPGDAVTGTAGDVGVVVNAAGRELLAVVRVADAATLLQINGTGLQPLPLPYAVGPD